MFRDITIIIIGIVIILFALFVDENIKKKKRISDIKKSCYRTDNFIFWNKKLIPVYNCKNYKKHTKHKKHKKERDGQF